MIEWQTDPDTAYDVFCILEAVEYKWTVNQVLEQPEALLNDVLMIASLYRKMKRLDEKNDHAD